MQTNKESRKIRKEKSPGQRTPIGQRIRTLCFVLFLLILYTRVFAFYNTGILRRPASIQTVMIRGVFYPTLQEAYNNAHDGDTIKLKTVFNIPYYLHFTHHVNVTIKGGYNDGWNESFGKTHIIITGCPGKVTFHNLIISMKPKTVDTMVTHKKEDPVFFTHLSNNFITDVKEFILVLIHENGLHQIKRYSFYITDNNVIIQQVFEFQRDNDLKIFRSGVLNLLHVVQQPYLHTM